MSDPACPAIPTIHVLSDSVGETARAVAQAAAAQFGVTHPKIEVIGKVKSAEQVISWLDEHARYHCETLGDDRLMVFYTLVHAPLRDEVSAYIDAHDNIYGVDLLTAAIDAISEISGLVPRDLPGALRVADINYFHRVEALEFTIEHDDGRNPSGCLARRRPRCASTSRSRATTSQMSRSTRTPSLPPSCSRSTARASSA